MRSFLLSLAIYTADPTLSNPSVTSLRVIDTRDIVRSSLLFALQDPDPHIDRMLVRTDGQYLSDAARNLDDPYLLKFCNKVAALCEVSKDSQECARYVADFFSLSTADIDGYVAGEVAGNYAQSLTAYLKQRLVNPSLPPLGRNRVISIVVFQLIEYYPVAKLQQFFQFELHGPMSQMALAAELVKHGVDMYRFVSLFDGNDGYFYSTLNAIARVQDFFFSQRSLTQATPANVSLTEASTPANVSAGNARPVDRSIWTLFSPQIFPERLSDVAMLVKKSTALMSSFRLNILLAPFTDKMMALIPSTLWIRIAPGTTPHKVTQAARRVAEAAKAANGSPLPVRTTEDDAAELAQLEREWGVIHHVRGFRQANAFYTWTRTLVPGQLMAFQQSLASDKEYLDAIEQDCVAFKFPTEFMKDLMIPGRSDRSLLVESMKGLGLFMTVLDIAQNEAERDRLVNNSKMIKFIATRIESLYYAAKKKEEEFEQRGIYFFGNSEKISNALLEDKLIIPDESLMTILFEYLRDHFQSFYQGFQVMIQRK
jgi:hypothetical protein